MGLRDRASVALDDALTALSSGPAGPLQDALIANRNRLYAPMRVAVIGRIKAGKSTMINALLGAEFAPTGREELTFNVTNFVRAEREGLVVHFKDGRPSQPQQLDWLERLVDRTKGDPAMLRSIRQVEVGLPNAMLDQLELIDTPGFGSFFEADSRNTLEYLGLTADDIDETTRRHAVGADAVVYLFARGIAASDRDLVADFEGASIGDFTPVNAIAILTKVDAYWSAESPEVDPLEVARNITSRLKGEPGVDRIFFDILPVCGLLAAGAQTMTDADCIALQGLAELSPETLAKRLKNAARFVSTEYDDVSVGPAARTELFNRIGQYGIWVATSFLRDDSTRAAELSDHLYELSGLPAVRQLLLAHYADRATLIKTGSAVNQTRALCSRASRNGDAAASAAAGVLEAFELNEHDFAELDLLRRVYRDDARLGLSDDEVQELIAVCGEHGNSCSARLRVSPDTAIPAMRELVVERVRYWRDRSDDFGLANQTSDAIRGLRRSYEVIAYHLVQAQEHLEMTI